jgi:16S rRNA (cytosine1402-N4)-methyltransferase
VTHVPVLAHEAIEALRVDPSIEGVFVDATFGRGGHTRLILERLSPRGRLFAFDRDPTAIQEGRSIQDERLTLIHARFSRMAEELKSRGVSRVAGVLMDLGVSSPQIDDPARGFSFRADGPLDMRMDTTSGETAERFLQRADVGEIREVIKSHGEERFAKQIAEAIVAARQGRTITRTRELAAIVGEAVRTREPGQDPATRTFQALRIHLNQELEELSLALPQALSLLAPGGRLAVISFHSLEDRAVKHFMRDAANPGKLPERLPIRAADLPKAKLRLVGKAVRPGADEVRANPRARSAILRVAEVPA